MRCLASCLNTFTTREEIGKYLSSLYGLIDSDAIRSHSVKQSLLNEAAEIARMDTHGQGHISSYDATFHALVLLIRATFIISITLVKPCTLV